MQGDKNASLALDPRWMRRAHTKYAYGSPCKSWESKRSRGGPRTKIPVPHSPCPYVFCGGSLYQLLTSAVRFLTPLHLAPLRASTRPFFCPKPLRSSHSQDTRGSVTLLSSRKRKPRRWLTHCARCIQTILQGTGFCTLPQCWDKGNNGRVPDYCSKELISRVEENP